MAVQVQDKKLVWQVQNYFKWWKQSSFLQNIKSFFKNGGNFLTKATSAVASIEPTADASFHLAQRHNCETTSTKNPHQTKCRKNVTRATEDFWRELTHFGRKNNAQKLSMTAAIERLKGWKVERCTSEYITEGWAAPTVKQTFKEDRKRLLRHAHND